MVVVECVLAGRGPLLSRVWKCARPQLKFVSLGLAHRLPHHNDDDNEDGQEDQDATNRHSHHCAVTHQQTGCCCFCRGLLFRLSFCLSSVSFPRGGGFSFGFTLRILFLCFSSCLYPCSIDFLLINLHILVNIFGYINIFVVYRK